MKFHNPFLFSGTSIPGRVLSIKEKTGRLLVKICQESFDLWENGKEIYKSRLECQYWFTSYVTFLSNFVFREEELSIEDSDYSDLSDEEEAEVVVVDEQPEERTSATTIEELIKISKSSGKLAHQIIPKTISMLSDCEEDEDNDSQIYNEETNKSENEETSMSEDKEPSAIEEQLQSLKIDSTESMEVQQASVSCEMKNKVSDEEMKPSSVSKTCSNDTNQLCTHHETTTNQEEVCDHEKTAADQHCQVTYESDHVTNTDHNKENTEEHCVTGKGACCNHEDVQAMNDQRDLQGMCCDHIHKHHTAEEKEDSEHTTLPLASRPPVNKKTKRDRKAKFCDQSQPLANQHTLEGRLEQRQHVHNNKCNHRRINMPRKAETSAEELKRREDEKQRQELIKKQKHYEEHLELDALKENMQKNLYRLQNTHFVYLQFDKSTQLHMFATLVELLLQSFEQEYSSWKVGECS